ncbi:MAG TPA: HAD-IA family hydrolase, partial [Acidiferrobacteraceae bacterium]|nr:HAD-IA family hydrolase [Acidiferrobacteraceae bacterium]
RQIIGLGLAEALLALFPAEDADTRAAIADRYRHYYFDPTTPPTLLFEGVQEGLETLRRAGYRLAIATGKSRRGLQQVLAQTPIADYFVASRCADESRSKPDPLMLHQLLQETRTAPERALMIGDTTFDLEMARNAHMEGLGVTYGAHAREQLQELATLGCAASFAEIPRWLT